MSGFNDNNQRNQYGGLNDGSSSGLSMNENVVSPSPPSSTSTNRGLPTKGAFANMTERERQALLAIRDKVTIMRRIGAVGGAAITYALLRRRKPTPGFGATIGFTILGSIAGGGLSMPFGVMWGKKDLKSVEDPSHFARILQSVADERTGRITPGVAQDGIGNPNGQSNRTHQFGAQSDRSSSGQNYPSFPPPSQSTRRTSQPSSNNQSNTWGDDTFDETVLYGAQSQSSSFPTSSTQSSDTKEFSSTPFEPSQQSNQSSRWAQIRGDQTTQPSSWDRLRQQNARQVYEKRNSENQRGREMENGDVRSNRFDAGSSSGTLADPSFGKGTSTNREKAQREYEASFDRERRGIDG